MLGKGHSSYTLTFDDAVKIHKRIRTSELQSRIAADYDVNGGRISEVKISRPEVACRVVAGQAAA